MHLLCFLNKKCFLKPKTCEFSILRKVKNLLMPHRLKIFSENPMGRPPLSFRVNRFFSHQNTP
ncbi:hypothetical protein RV134_270186 [Roseovarius sp. EC-HK134]|nr:hypothetical protein RV420_310022 [Roseovarius sp. EC-SD190]VVT14774.1 hypothetical protein RV134_270186 [Roseovarius sp. EC-HK134]